MMVLKFTTGGNLRGFKRLISRKTIISVILMCIILETFIEVLKRYWDLVTLVMHLITSRQSAPSLLMNRISSNQSIHVKSSMEAVVDMAREANIIMTMVSVSAKSTNLMEEMIMETVIILEKLFKRG